MAIGVVGVVVALLCVWLFLKAVTFFMKVVLVLVALAALAVGVGVATGRIDASAIGNAASGARLDAR